MTSVLQLSQPTGSTTVTAEHGSGDTSFTALHTDIIDVHILTRLDGPTLASASCSSTTLHNLSSQNNLWSRICHSTWPSTATPRVSRIISAFPGGGARAFFAHSFAIPLPELESTTAGNSIPGGSSSPPPELISAVDIHYKNELIFTKAHETETVSSWFQCSPFRIDLLDPKDVIPTSIEHPNEDEKCRALIDDMTLSWIMIDPIGRRTMNLSSYKPVSAQRHWLSGEVQVKFASIISTSPKNCKTFESDRVQFAIMVTCGASEVGDMQVREVSLEVENMDGTYLNGKDSLVILHRALGGKIGNGINRVEIGRERYTEFLEMKRERKEKKLRIEWALDVLSVGFGVTIFVGFWCFLLCR